MLRAGALNQKITLETSTTVPDAYGQEHAEWGGSQEVWAQVRYQSAKEVFQADQQSAVQTVIFTIRHRSGVSAAKTRVLFDGQTYNITGVTVVGNREGLNLIGEAENNG